MYDIPFDRSFLQLSNGIRHVMPSTDPKPELTAKASMAQPVSQPAVYANGLMVNCYYVHVSLSDAWRSAQLLNFILLIICFGSLILLHTTCRSGENQHQSCVNVDEKSAGADLVMV
jgi:hypothetical protein